MGAAEPCGAEGHRRKTEEWRGWAASHVGAAGLVGSATLWHTTHAQPHLGLSLEDRLSEDTRKGTESMPLRGQ